MYIYIYIYYVYVICILVYLFVYVYCSPVRGVEAPAEHARERDNGSRREEPMLAGHGAADLQEAREDPVLGRQAVAVHRARAVAHRDEAGLPHSDLPPLVGPAEGQVAARGPGGRLDRGHAPEGIDGAVQVLDQRRGVVLLPALVVERRLHVQAALRVEVVPLHEGLAVRRVALAVDGEDVEERGPRVHVGLVGGDHGGAGRGLHAAVEREAARLVNVPHRPQGRGVVERVRLRRPGEGADGADATHLHPAGAVLALGIAVADLVVPLHGAVQDEGGDRPELVVHAQAAGGVDLVLLQRPDGVPGLLQAVLALRAVAPAGVLPGAVLEDLQAIVQVAVGAAPARRAEELRHELLLGDHPHVRGLPAADGPPVAEDQEPHVEAAKGLHEVLALHARAKQRVRGHGRAVADADREGLAGSLLGGTLEPTNLRPTRVIPKNPLHHPLEKPPESPSASLHNPIHFRAENLLHRIRPLRLIMIVISMIIMVTVAMLIIITIIIIIIIIIIMIIISSSSSSVIVIIITTIIIIVIVIIISIVVIIIITIIITIIISIITIIIIIIIISNIVCIVTIISIIIISSSSSITTIMIIIIIIIRISFIIIIIIIIISVSTIIMCVIVIIVIGIGYHYYQY